MDAVAGTTNSFIYICLFLTFFGIVEVYIQLKVRLLAFKNAYQRVLLKMSFWRNELQALISRSIDQRSLWAWAKQLTIVLGFFWISVEQLPST